MIKQYRKKPVVISAVQWTGENANEILEFCADAKISGPKNLEIETLEFCAAAKFIVEIGGPKRLEIETLEGNMRADIGDYIIRGVKGEFYPCKPDVFEKTYEPIQ